MTRSESVLPTFTTTLTSNPASDERLAEILENPGFGNHFTDHMFVAEWTPEAGWHDARIEPYGPLSLDPASAVLHYGQEAFEGLKAYRRADGGVQLFRPEANAKRLRKSSRRMALPEVDTDLFVAAVEALVKVDERWVPEAPEGQEKSLYIRPFLFASEAFLGVRSANHVTFMVILSPAGAYFKTGAIKPVRIWLDETYTRAGRGGTGNAKVGGNYAASLLPQVVGYAQGCDQVVFLDASEGKWIEELGGMNLFFVYGDGHLVTPESDTILEGITRDSTMTLAEEQGLKVEMRKVAIDEWKNGVAAGEITEVFACGTAAVITPVGELVWEGGAQATKPTTRVAEDLRRQLLDIQYGRVPDTHGWVRELS